MAIPLKTLRYSTGDEQDVGLQRAAQHPAQERAGLPGADSARLRHLSHLAGGEGERAQPAGAPRRQGDSRTRSARRTRTSRAPSATSSTTTGDVGVDVKWGIRPNLTLDATVNTDFAQVEADEEQVNLTRFDLFFPEKRPFFLENASTFQFGQPQAIDLFFTPAHRPVHRPACPIDILGGARLSGKVAGGWNVGLLNIQTNDLRSRRESAAPTQIVAPDNNFTRRCARRRKSAARATARIFVGRYATGDTPAGFTKWNRAYGARRQHPAVDEPAALDVHRAHRHARRRSAATTSGRAFYNFTNNLWQVSGGYSQVGERLQSRGGLPAAPRLPPAGVPRVLLSRSRRTSSGSAASRRTTRTTRTTASTASCRRR